MKIEKLSVSNFRNIKSGSYTLYNRSAFEGRNHIGKTNLVEAVYWLLTGSLINGSADVASLKPNDDKKAVVSVEATFENGWKFRKDYFENWVKTRGTDEVILKGHSTEFYVNGVKLASEKEATKQLWIELGIEGFTIKTSKVDLMKLLVNPLYASEQLEWKTLRELIIELVGDITDDDVIKEDNRLINLKPLLNQFAGNTDIALRSLKQQVAVLKDKNIAIQGTIEFLNSKPSVTEAELLDAKSHIALINQQIADLKVGTASDALQKDLIDKRNEVNDLYNEEQRTFASEQFKKRQEVSDASANYQFYFRKVELQKMDEDTRVNLAQRVENAKINVDELKQKLDFINSEKWMDENASVCPNCHYILNRDEVEAKKAEQIKVAEANLKVAESVLKSEEERLTSAEAKQDKTDYSKLLKDAEAEQDRLSAVTFEAYQPSKTLSDLKEAYNSLLIKYRNAKDDDEQKYAMMKSNLEASLAPYQTLIETDDKYRFSQSDLAMQNGLLTANQRAITKAEQMQLLLSDFIAQKLKMLNQNVSKVFGDIKFVLAESNIKAGSWNEVCYPLIVGTDIPFEHGSSSEKIKTGFLILEAIKKYLGAPNLPIIFDECEKFDNYNLDDTFKTSSQIITAKVCDIYLEPTIVDFSIVK